MPSFNKYLSAYYVLKLEMYQEGNKVPVLVDGTFQ